MQIKLQQFKSLREMLKYEIINAKHSRHKNAFISMLQDIKKLYNKYTEDICDLYSVEYSSLSGRHGNR